jgi:tetratricopeptide (TPR) repeat protein
MLETMREFGYICLRENGELERCQREHALYYLTLVEQAAPELKGHEQMDWLQRLESEGENLRAAQQWLVEHGETILALRFAEACGKFYGLRGYWGEEWYWLRAVLALPLPADLQEGRAIRARVLRRAGHLAYRLRHLNEARQWQQESVRLSRAVDDQVNLAGALSGLAWTIYRQQEEAALTDQYLQESLVAARASGDRWCLANTLESIGRYEYYQGDYAVAHALLDESVQLAREIGDRESLARILTTAILIELSEQHLEQAERLTDESMRLAHELGTRPLIALILDRRIDIALARKDYARAAMLCQERIDIAQELGDHPTVAHKYLQLGEIALTQARPRSALVYAQNALKLFQEQHDCPNITATQTLLAAIASSSSSE